jgi:hypothetical protein
MKAAPRPTTTQISNNVKTGTVSMFDIPRCDGGIPADGFDKRLQFSKNTERIARDLPPTVLDAFGVGSSRIPREI